ncbi:MAG TPA: aminoacyl-tRNA hydrolase, partial [Eubacterium sp.]|nr:aminoacyl-tRNA hydrolase [Eubacterium sp.]
KRHRALCGIGNVNGEKVILVKPQTYMNSSGEAVKKVVDFYKLDSTQNLIVISDDINLDIGRIRIRKSGSAGGHNGLKNIIAHLKSEDFTRVRVGVGENGGNSDLIKHVLGKFSKAERAKIDEAAKTSADAILDIIEHDEEYAMNKYNS